LWTQVDETLIALATRELVGLGLLEAGLVEDGVVFRQPKAYPVYDREYRRNVELVRSYLDGIVNLQSFGRNGMHRYNNLDHSMLAGMLAARNVLGEHHDLWSVNTEQTYLEGG
jgi:protoporphyrinogen oxidase